MPEEYEVFIQDQSGEWVDLGWTVEGPDLREVPQRYILGADDPESENFRPGSLRLPEPEYLAPYLDRDAEVTEEFLTRLLDLPVQSDLMVDSMTSMYESLTRMNEALSHFRESDPHLFEDIETYPMSSDAMRVSYSDGREDRPL